jgi:hypothetical protein
MVEAQTQPFPFLLEGEGQMTFGIGRRQLLAALGGAGHGRSRQV